MEELHFQAAKDRVRARLNKFTRKAFRMLPEMNNPRILDLGCGSGVPTMELARLSRGQITALDIDRDQIERLVRKIEIEGLTDRVKAVKSSIFELEFPEQSFDIIWAEGSIAIVGFERGLREWKRFLKPGGFLVVHDDQRCKEIKFRQIADCGYELLGYFELDEEVWGNEYYRPLQKLVEKTRNRASSHPRLLAQLERERQEIEVYSKNPSHCSSIFFVMKLRNP
jgi:ubiquinone/menaquinone biosynthesis C-methylase UbiE